jgi:hypothetical protein
VVRGTSEGSGFAAKKPAPGLRLEVGGEEPLQDHHVPPGAVEPGVLLVDPDLAEAGRPEEPPARRVLDEDAGDSFQKPALSAAGIKASIVIRPAPRPRAARSA